MQFITLEEGKQYLRVDSGDEDAVIEALLNGAEVLCCEVARLSEEQWEAVCAEKWDQERGTVPTTALTRNRTLMRTAILYTLGYLFEHREDADHHALTLTLRSILLPIREGVL